MLFKIRINKSAVALLLFLIITIVVKSSFASQDGIEVLRKRQGPGQPAAPATVSTNGPAPTPAQGTAQGSADPKTVPKGENQPDQNGGQTEVNDPKKTKAPKGKGKGKAKGKAKAKAKAKAEDAKQDAIPNAPTVNDPAAPVPAANETAVPSANEQTPLSSSPPPSSSLPPPPPTSKTTTTPVTEPTTPSVQEQAVTTPPPSPTPPPPPPPAPKSKVTITSVIPETTKRVTKTMPDGQVTVVQEVVAPQTVVVVTDAPTASADGLEYNSSNSLIGSKNVATIVIGLIVAAFVGMFSV